jgi:integrase
MFVTDRPCVEEFTIAHWSPHVKNYFSVGSPERAMAAMHHTAGARTQIQPMKSTAKSILTSDRVSAIMTGNRKDQAMRTPKLRFHKSTRRYLVTLDGRDVYLGRDRKAAEKKYYALLMARLDGDTAKIPVRPGASTTIAQIAEAYEQAMRLYYGKDRWGRGQIAVRHLVGLFGHVRPDEFRVSDLRTVREQMLKTLCRREVNLHVREVVKFFKWATSMEHCSPDVYGRLMTLEPLKAGRSAARETAPVEAVPLEVVNRTLPFLPTLLRDVVALQLLTGARGGEILGLCGSDIDRAGNGVWRARLAHHKTAHRGKTRTLYFGPQAQAVLMAPAYASAGDGPIFAKFGKIITSGAYCQAIQRACVLAEVDPWHPHQLRHTAATELRRRFGVEAARVILGHSSLDTTGIYAEADTEKAESIIARIG